MEKTQYRESCRLDTYRVDRNEIGKRNTLLGERIHLYYKAYARRAGIPVPADLEKELKHAG